MKLFTSIVFALFFLAATTPVSSQSLCFDPANDVRYETYGQCHDLGVLDFNNDGNLDVLAAGGDLVSVHLGNGDGTFQQFTTSPPGTNVDLELADFDGDGDLDMYTYGGGNLVAGRNNGNGTMEWFAYLGVSLMSNLNSEISTGDVTGDGNMDVVANDAGDTKLYVFECDATGAPVSTFSLTTPYAPGNVKVGDLNGDNYMDIVCSFGTNDNIAFYLSNGDGTFDETVQFAGTPVGAGYGSVEIADVTGDGNNDILVAGLTMMYVLKNNGNETFTALPNVAMGSYCYGFDTGDWDDDGDIDVAWANNNTGGISVHLNNGDGTFPPAGVVFYSGNGDALELAVGDFNEDGSLDIVVANGYEGNFAYLEGHGDGTFGSRTLLAGYSASGIAAADFDNDGDMDVVATNSGSVSSSVLALSRNNGDGSFADTEFFPNINGAGECVAGDFNEDGNMDLAVHSPDGYAIHLGNGNGTFMPWTLYDTNNMGAGGDRPCTMGDFNYDGHLDLAGSRPGSDAVSVVLGNGNGTFDAPEILLGASYPRTLMAQDFNNDNYDDLVVVANTTDEVWIYFSDGDGTFSAPLALAAAGNPEGLTAFDADEDGITDLIVGSPNANVIYTFISNNNGTFDAAIETDLPTGSNASRLAHADINNDGHEDILGALYQNDAVGAIFGNGDGTFDSAISYGVDQGPGIVLVADFNDDGAVDFATLNTAIFNVSVVLNNSAFITADGELAFCEGEEVTLTASTGYSYLWSNGETTQSIVASENGELYCSITNQAGDCTLITPSVEIEVFVGQEVTLELDSTFVCVENGDFFLSGGYPFGGQYSGPGVVANVFDPTTLAEGTYTITYTFEDTGECTSGSATDEITVDICSGIGEEEMNGFLVFPTVSNSKFTIAGHEAFSFRILDMYGRIVEEDTGMSSQHTVSIENYRVGMYLVQVTASGRTENFRVEKIR